MLEHLHTQRGPHVVTKKPAQTVPGQGYAGRAVKRRDPYRCTPARRAVQGRPYSLGSGFSKCPGSARAQLAWNTYAARIFV